MANSRYSLEVVLENLVEVQSLWEIKTELLTGDMIVILEASSFMIFEIRVPIRLKGGKVKKSFFSITC